MGLNARLLRISWCGEGDCYYAIWRPSVGYQIKRGSPMTEIVVTGAGGRRDRNAGPARSRPPFAQDPDAIERLSPCHRFARDDETEIAVRARNPEVQRRFRGATRARTRPSSRRRALCRRD